MNGIAVLVFVLLMGMVCHDDLFIQFEEWLENG